MAPYDRGRHSATTLASTWPRETTSWFATETQPSILNAITQIALALSEPGVGGVAGTLRVKNPKDSFITRLQVLEYLFSIEVGRQFASRYGILHIVSGAFGGFRAEAVRRLHGWEVSPGEDADMTKGLRKAGYKIRFNPTAVAYTDVPRHSVRCSDSG